jgi:putative SOS response-associated peptidase YedK
MCGRFTLASSTQKLAEAFAGFEFPQQLPPRYNIAPSQPIAVVANNSQPKVELFLWGLIPSWAKDPTGIINARSETLAEKPSFKNAYKRRRCLILADGFYEWQASPAKGEKGGGGKTPVYIRLASGEPFAFAGLWEMWHPAEEAILSCTIITTSPNELMTQIHNRMPVILPPETYQQWLDPAERRPEELNGLLKPYPAELMMAYPVSKLVNNPKNDSSELIEPVAGQKEAG